MNKRKSGSKTDWDVKADKAIEAARSMEPGPLRHKALKRAGYLRLMAELMRQIGALEKPVRGKKPNSTRRKKAAMFSDPYAFRVDSAYAQDADGVSP